MTTGGPPAGWYLDPTGRFTYRYWDGLHWTDQVSSAGRTGSDPIEDPTGAMIPPAPGTAASIPSDPPPQTIEVSTGGSSAAGALLALVAVAILVVLIVVLVTQDGEDDTTSTTDGVATTVTTEAPDADDGG